jgi:hypothetical protein
MKKKDDGDQPRTVIDLGARRPPSGGPPATAPVPPALPPALPINALIERVRADLDRLPIGEKTVVAGGLYVLDRCARAVERIESLVEEQRASVRRGREILELLPPLIGKLGELLDTELADAKARLEDRLKGRR